MLYRHLFTCALALTLSGCAAGLWPFTGGPSVQTFVSGGKGFADGPASQARFYWPEALALGADGTLYVCDTGNSAIRKVTPAGEVSTVAGDADGYAEGKGAQARFSRPTGITVGPNGVLYVADTGNHRIRTIAPDGTVSTLAGSIAGKADGTAGEARFLRPSALVATAEGRVYVADAGNNLIRLVEPDGTVKTVAGGGDGGDDAMDGQGSSARFQLPRSLAIAPEGHLWIADGDKLRRLDAAGNVTTVASLGLGMQIYGNNGMSGASYGSASSIVCDQDGTVYAAFPDRIQQVDREGKVSFVAGFNDTVMTSFDGNVGDADGAGGSARFRVAWGLALDGRGNLFVCEREPGRIRKLALR